MEEYGLLGSTEYAASYGNNSSRYAMISLEMLVQFYPGSQRYPPGLERFYNRGDFIGLIGNLPTIPDLIRLSRSIHKAGVLSEWLPAPNRGLIVPQTRLAIMLPLGSGLSAMMVTDTAFYEIRIIIKRAIGNP